MPRPIYNGAFATTYTYDPETFRLTRLKTTRESWGDGMRIFWTPLP